MCNLRSSKFKEFLKQEDLLFPELDDDLIKSYQRHLKKIGNATNIICNAISLSF
ncbi:phage integrase SAM-like domain-containing protein [Runella sp. MFBS21]|uniref:phage integrase SAM-like domain-containing protein n=1 Tax=Runella sp. MFBS21 TaxID=3034018 RepID=UPI00288420DB|nr:phage integrase SAM-like domain-containing protein [Runella sp. MFBS21]